MLHKKHKIKVLYVDDERLNLLAFRASFRKEFKVILAENAVEGLEYLEKEEIPVVISDQKMPNITGIEFLEMVKDRYPDCIRILLTAYSDIDVVVSAINKGKIYEYIPKPWNEVDVRIAIENGYNLYKTNRELHTKNLELQKRNEELSSFIYSGSHDMRAPLTTIQGVLEVAKLTEADSAALPYFDMIEENVNKLDDYLCNLIAFHQNFKNKLKFSEVNWEEFFEELNLQYHYSHHFPNVKMSIKMDEQNRFVSDKLRLSAIMHNLIGNAFQFQNKSDKGGFVRVEGITSQKQAEIRIKDNGIGIAEDEINKIFDMFYKSHAHSNGSGMGLYIVKETLEKMGGHISVESIPGEGSCFKIVIPNCIDTEQNEVSIN